jgi:hypothetical protein
MEIAERFEYDDAGLRRVRAEIGRMSAAGCPWERESLLNAVESKSLPPAPVAPQAGPPEAGVAMFAGHVGAALAIGRVERRVNIGAFVAAALLLDLVLWLFVLLGWESVAIPTDFARTHQPEFTFPYSHGLLSSALWSALAGAVAFVWSARVGVAPWRVGVLIAGAVFSHWLLDALVHLPELPLAGAGSPKVGLGLWQRMPVALVVEAGIVVVGLWLFLPGSTLSRGRSIGVAALSLALLAFTILGMTIAPPPPSASAMAGSSLVTLVAVCLLACWLGRAPREGPA